jgi:hypothetical protein
MGAHTVVANYSGDASFTASTGTLPGGQTVTNKSLSNTALTSSVNPAVFGQNITFTASVTASGGNGMPTGTVQFVIDGTNFGSLVSLTSGVATSGAVSNLSVNSHTVQAVYSGDATFANSTASLTQTVAKATTAALFGAAPGPAVSGQSLTFTATISVLSPGAGSPTGTVQFMIDGAAAGNPVSVSSAGGLTAASFTTNSLAPGAHTVTASYSGDGNFAPSLAIVLTQMATKASTTTVLVSSANTSVSGQTVNFTATVSAVAPGGGTPSGTVQFVVDGSPAGSPVNVTTAGGVTTASFSTASLTVGTHTIAASYSGDGNFTSSLTTTITQTTSKASTSTVVSSSANASVSGQGIAFTATVGITAPGTGSPSGSVQFVIDGGNLGSPVTLTGGVATSSTVSTFAVGNHTIQAVYSGDSIFTTSLGALTQTVNQASTTTSVTSSTSVTGFGQSILFIATISANAPGAGTPTGTVQFVIDGTSFGSPVSVTNGVATSSAANNLSVSSHTIKAVYSGDATFTASTGTFTQAVAKAGTSATLSSVGNPSAFGQVVTFKATVSPTPPGAGSPTGTVQFMVDGSDAGSPVNLSTTGGVTTASFSTASLAVGTHTIIASYSGDGSFTGSTGTVTQTVGKANTSTILSSSANSLLSGQSITFTATVSAQAPGGGAPSGTVQFVVDSSNAGSPVSLSTAGSVVTASFSTALPGGVHTITASYSGDGNFASSTATALTQTVGKATTIMVLASSANPAVSGQSITFTASIGVAAPGTGTPSGAVQFVIDGSNAGNATTVSGTGSVASASFSIASLAPGTHTVMASYSGDSSFTSSTTGVLTQTVGKAGTSIAVTASGNPSAFGQGIAFTATVNVTAPGSGMPTGSIQFVMDGGNFGSPVSLMGGIATSNSTSSLSAGGHTIQAIYSGDPTFAMSTGMLAQTVKPASTSLVISSSANPVLSGQPASFTATLAVTSPGAGTPSGTVQFVVDGSPAGSPVSVSIAGGVITASFSTASLTVGTHTISASYGGDGSFAPSSGMLTPGQTILSKPASSTVVSSSLNPSMSGQSITFTATVTASAGNGTPTGAIQFVIDGSNAGTPVNLSSAGSVSTASLSSASLTVGTHTIAASYSGDANFASSNGSLLGGQTVINKPLSTTVISSSASPSVFGQSITFTASVTASASGGTPTGTLQFMIDGTSFGNPVNLAGGVATSRAISLSVSNHIIQAVYSGDSSFSGSTGSFTQTVIKASTNTIVSSSLSSAIAGQTITFTATVGVSSPGAGTPSGTIQFVIDGANAASPQSLSGSGGLVTASFATSSLGAGTHTFSASYSGDSSFAGSTGLVTQTVNRAHTSTALSSSVSSSLFGQSVTFTALQAVILPGGGTPTGTIQFVVDGSSAGSPVSLSSGSGGALTASFTTTSLTAGTHTITASYSGDSSFTSSTANSLTQTVGIVNTSTVLSSSANPSSFSQSITFTASVTANASSSAATGAVQFLVDGSDAGSPISVTNSGRLITASFSTASLSAGTHVITAAYSGDANFTSSTGTLTQVVSKVSTITALSLSVNTPVSGQNLTFSAAITSNATGATPTGTIQFVIDGSSAGSPMNLVGGVARVSTSLAAGVHTVQATYSGDASFAGSAGSLTQTVNKAGSTTLVSSSTQASVFGQSVGFTATIGAAAPGTGTLSGTVQFVVDGSPAGSPVSVSSAGGVTSASFSTASLTVGTHTIAANYSGDDSFATSLATALTQTVTKATSNTVLASSANSPVFGQGIAFTATVLAVAPSSGAPSGTVQFVVDGVNFGSSVSLTGGIATSNTVSTLAVASHTIQAVYSGDNSFTTSLGALNQTVNQASTSIAVSSSANPLVFGQSITLTASISVIAPGAGSPSGTVQFLVDGTNAGNPVAVSTNGGPTTASLTTTSLPVGAHTVSASYSGDSNFSGGTASTVMHAVGKAGSTTVVSSSASPAVTGQSITFTATVSPVAPASGTPSGTVQFLLDGSPAGSPVPLSSSGAQATASLSTASLALGTHTIAASYSGDSSFSTSTASSLTQTVAKASSMTVISSSVNPSVSGQNVSFTATVGVAAPGMGTPSGTVQFVVDGSPAGSPVSVTTAGGLTTASFSTASLTMGTHAVVVNYSGDTSFTASTDTLPGGQTITGKPLSTTILSSSANPAVFGQNLTFTANVTASGGNGTPTGTVQFVIDGTNLGGPVSLTSGVAISGAVSNLTVANHTIQAIYSGDTTFASGTASLTQTVSKESTSTVVASSPDPSVFGQLVSFTAVISVLGTGAGAPTGTVQFMVDGATLGTPVNLSNSGGAITASFTTASLAVGTHTITASYSGDANFSGSAATALTQMVGKSSTSTVLISSVQAPVFGQGVSFTATVNVASPGGGAPSGTVQFVVDGSPAGSPVSVSSAGGVTTASFSTSSLTVGTHTIAAGYSGDGSFTSSLATALTQTVTKATTATVLASSSNPSTSGESVSFTATVVAIAPGGGPLTGAVQFILDGRSVGSPVSLSNTGGVLSSSFSTTSLLAGTHTITASYSGDANSTSSTSSTLTQTVSKAGSITAVSPSSNPAVFGQSVLFTATVSNTVPGSGTPTGTVQFLLDGTSFGGPVNLIGGVATSAATSSLSVNGHTIQAVYSGDSSFTGSMGMLTQTVSKATTSTLVRSSINPAISGQNLTFTTTISVPSPGAGTPSGTVQFVIDGANAGNPVKVNSAGGVATAAFSSSSLAVGIHTITASYSGDSSFTGSTATAITLTVNRAMSSTLVLSSASPSVYGQDVTFTAQVSPLPPGAGTPTGMVQFLIDGASFGSPVSLVGGVATSGTVSGLTVGNHTIQAVYSSDLSFTDSSGSLTQNVNQASTTTVLTSSANPSVSSQGVSFVATVGISDPGAGTPTGTVQFMIDGSNAGSPVSVSTTGGMTTASLSTPSLAVGRHTITASYSGDNSFSSSTASALTQTVSQASTNLLVSSSVNPAVFGQNVIFTATVAASDLGSITPTGAVQFQIDGSDFAPPVTLTDGVARSAAISNLPEGEHTIQAVYSGDANFSASTGTFSQEVITQTASVLLVSGFPSPATAGASGSFTVTVQDSSGNTVPGYRGTIHFSSTDSVASLPADYTFTAADNGVHTFNAVFRTAGSQSLTATDLSGSLNGSQSEITIVSAAADHFLLTPSVNTTTAGMPFDFIVMVQDAYNNLVAGYTGTVVFSSADPYGASLPAAYTFTADDGGVHAFAGGAILYTAGTWNLTVSDTSNPALTGSANLLVVAAGPDHFLIAPSASTTVAGTPFDFTVTVQDLYNNTVTGYTGTVTFSSADPYGAGLPADYTFTADDGGVHGFASAAILYTAGTWDIIAADTSAPALTGSAHLFVVAAAPDHFLITPSVSTSVAGTPFDITVTVRDAYNNTVTGYTGTLTFSSADPYGASLPAAYTFAADDGGVHTFAGSAILYTVGTWNITATDTGNPALTGSTIVQVTPSAASHFLILAPSSAVAGVAFDLTIEAVDPYGNVDTNYVTDPSGVVHFSTTDPDPGVGLPSDFQFTAADQGKVTFAGGVILITPGNQTLMAMDTVSGLTDDGSAVVTVVSPGGGAPPRRSSTPTGNAPIFPSIASQPSPAIAISAPAASGVAAAPRVASGVALTLRELVDQVFATPEGKRGNNRSDVHGWNYPALSEIGDALISRLHQEDRLQ